MIFGEESSLAIYEICNRELFELGQICEYSVSFLLEAPARGIEILWMRRLSSTRIKARFQALIVPFFLARVNRSTGKKHGDSQWQQDH